MKQSCHYPPCHRAGLSFAAAAAISAGGSRAIAARFRHGLGMGVLVCAIHVCAPPGAQAAEWNAADGDFGSAANWAEGAVPDEAATPVNIANGGSAQIDALGSYMIGALMLGDHSGVGSIVQTGGCLNTRRIILGGDDGSGGTGHGVYSIHDGTLKSVADEIWIGSKGGEGTLELTGTSLVTSASWVVVGRDGASGHLSLSGSAQLEVLSGNLPVGCNSNGYTSTMEVGDSARVNAADEIWVGWLGDNRNHGIMNLSGHAAVKTGNGFTIGRNGAKGTVAVVDDSSLEVGGHLVCGADPGGHGEITLRDGAHVHAGKQILLGFGGASGRITVDGGCLTSHAVPGEDASGAGIAFLNDGVFTVNGGKVSTPGFIKRAGVARLIFNGGVLRATGKTSGGGFFVNFADEDLWIGPRGLRFDTKALAIEVEQSIDGEGELIKLGSGSLVLKGTAGHAGDTEVAQGRLILQAPLLSDSHRILITGAGSRLRLEHGQVDRVAKLLIDGVVQPAGRYTAMGNPADGTEIGQLEGSGSLDVRLGPGEVTFAEWIARHAPAAGFEIDSDGDGIANGTEQVFGSDPNVFTPLHHSLEGGQLLLEHPLGASLAADVIYRYEWSCDLHDWHPSGHTDSQGTRVEITAFPSAAGIEAHFQVISGSAPRLFGRVAASQIPLP